MRTCVRWITRDDCNFRLALRWVSTIYIVEGEVVNNNCFR